LSIWEALVEFDRSRPRRGEQIVAALRAAVMQGRLAPGTRLPSTRDLAADLAVSRGLVVAAYEQLTAEGRLVTLRGSGTLVAPQPAAHPAAQRAAQPAAQRAAQPAAQRAAQPAAQRAAQPAAQAVAPWPQPRAPLPLRPGVPDLGLFPRTAWRRAYERALATALDADLDYGDPAGAPRLRAELAGYLGRVRAARVEPAGLCVTTGAAQAFTLLAGMLRARGVSRIGVEDPGSAIIRRHVAAHGLRPVPVPVDEGGLDVAALAATRLTAVLVTPAHQFPTGVVLAPARRAALVDWARRVGGLVVEDDYDAEFRYDREPVGCVQGLAPDAVALVGSASKVLAPALRIGWLAAPPAWVDQARDGKESADHGGPVVEQLAFAELLAAGNYDRHLRRVRRVYRDRRDAVVRALRRHLPAARVSGVAAGLHLVVELDGCDDRALAARAEAAGLGPLPLSALRQRPPGVPGLVVGYATHSAGELTHAVRRLAGLVQQAAPATAGG
jgi:GntR family transcriptional regulator / MocR family aminotransferase